MTTASFSIAVDRINRYVVTPLAWGISASIVGGGILALALTAWGYHVGMLPLDVFLIGGAVTLAFGTMVIFFPPPGVADRERVIALWLARAGWAAARGAWGLAWEYLIQPIVESAYVVVLTAFAIALEFALICYGVTGVNILFDNPRHPDLPSLHPGWEFAEFVADFVVLLAACAITAKVIWKVAAAVRRLVDRRDKVRYDFLRDRNRPLGR